MGVPPAANAMATKRRKERAVRLVRAVMLDSGLLRCTFSDNATLVLDKDGRAFAVAAPHGASGSAIVTRQLARFAIKDHRPRLALALAFRNMHVDTPFVCDAVLAPPATSRVAQPPPPPAAGTSADGAHIFHAPHRVTSLRWHASPAEAAKRECVALAANGATTVASACGRGQLTISPTGHRFSVVYPLLLGAGYADPARPRECAYVWQRQTFSTAEGGHPARWDAALSVALLSVRATDQDAGGNAEAKAAEIAMGSLHVYTDLPCGDADATIDGHADAESLARVRNALMSRPEDKTNAENWWRDCSLTLLPPKALVHLEWGPECLLQYLPAKREVEVVLGADGTVMQSQHNGRTFLHHRGAAAGPDVYVAGQEPPAMGSVDIAAVLRSAESLLNHCMRVEDAEKSSQHAPPPMLYPSSCLEPGGVAASDTPSGDVLEEQLDETGNRYRLFADGHVRAMFVDRTLVELDAALERAIVTHADGRRYVCRCSHPVGAEAYVRCALEFAAWARRSPTERAAQAEREMEVLREHSKLHRMSRLCEYSANPGTACRDLPLPTSGVRLQAEGSVAAEAAFEEARQATPPLPHGGAAGEAPPTVRSTPTPPTDWDLSTISPSDRDAIIAEQLRRTQLWLEQNQGTSD